MDIRTPKQKEQSRRYEKVASFYDQLRKENPDARPLRLMSVMAENRIEGLTSICGIRTALIRTGRFFPSTK